MKHDMSMKDKPFDYASAVAELEKIAARVEDPATPLQDIDEEVRRSRELIAACRKYLRSVREKTEDLDI